MSAQVTDYTASGYSPCDENRPDKSFSAGEEIYVKNWDGDWEKHIYGGYKTKTDPWGNLVTHYIHKVGNENSMYSIPDGARLDEYVLSAAEYESMDKGNIECAMCCAGDYAAIFKAQFLTLINNYRAENGLAALKFEPVLDEAAQRYTNVGVKDADKTLADQHGADGRTPRERILEVAREKGYVIKENGGMERPFAGPTGENAVVIGRMCAQEAFDRWKKSPPHNSQMLNGNHKFIGIGVSCGKRSSGGSFIFAVNKFAPDPWTNDDLVNEEPKGVCESCCTADKAKTFKSEFLKLINDYRASKGIAALTLEPVLGEAAQRYTNLGVKDADKTMADQHGADGRTPRERILEVAREKGYVIKQNGGMDRPFAGPTGENAVVIGYMEAQEAFDRWKNSPPHNSQMLNAGHKHIGIGVSCGLRSSGSSFIFAVNKFAPDPWEADDDATANDDTSNNDDSGTAGNDNSGSNNTGNDNTGNNNTGDDNSAPTISNTDLDGNEYETVQIGNQIWMVENLKTTKCADGTPISESLYKTDWKGRPLYSSAAFEQCDICPSGWRVPSKQDVKDLKASGQSAEEVKSTLKWDWESMGGSSPRMHVQEASLGIYTASDLNEVMKYGYGWTVKGQANEFFGVRCVRDAESTAPQSKTKDIATQTTKTVTTGTDLSSSSSKKNRAKGSSKKSTTKSEPHQYQTIQIGNQEWITENLQETTCSDGSAIDPATYRTDWKGRVQYTSMALEACNVCPSGYRVPTKEDVKALKHSGFSADELREKLQWNYDSLGGTSSNIHVQGASLGVYSSSGLKEVMQYGYGWTVKGDADDFYGVRCVKEIGN